MAEHEATKGGAQAAGGQVGGVKVFTWRELLATTRWGKQNASKRAAIERMLRAHPDWSNRRIARSVHIIIVTDDELDQEVRLAE